MRVACFKVNQLGDNVVFLPVVQALRRHFPTCHLRIYTTPLAAPLYEGTAREGELVLTHRNEFHQQWKRPWKLLKTLWNLRRFKPDLCLLSDDEPNVVHLLAKYSGARWRAGTRQPWVKVPGSVNIKVETQPNEKVAFLNWRIFRLGLMAAKGHDAGEHAPPPDLAALTKGVQAEYRCFVIHPGASHVTKRWPLERFARLANLLSEKARVIWIEQPDLGEVTLSGQVQRVTTATLIDLIRLIASAHVFIGNNSGPMNLAMACARPMMIFTGKSSLTWDPAWHRDRVMLLRREELECLHCEDRVGFAANCPRRDEPLACLLRWTPEHVAALAMDFAEKQPFAPA